MHFKDIIEDNKTKGEKIAVSTMESEKDPREISMLLQQKQESLVVA